MTQTIFPGPVVPCAQVFNSTAVTAFPNNTWTPINMDSEVYDLPNNDQHSTSTNTSRLTCVVPGVYLMEGHLEFSSTSTAGSRFAGVYFNGSLVAISGGGLAANIAHGLTATLVHRLAVGDFVQFAAFQNSGGTTNQINATGWSPVFSFTWLSP